MGNVKPRTMKHRLADALLGTPLVSYVNDRRERGLSWDRIARDLERDTNGEVFVSGNTLRMWINDRRANGQ